MNFLVHEIARMSEVSADTVRKCDRKGLITSTRDGNGWRRFSLDVVQTLRERYAKDPKKMNGPAVISM